MSTVINVLDHSGVGCGCVCDRVLKTPTVTVTLLDYETIEALNGTGSTGFGPKTVASLLLSNLTKWLRLNQVMAPDPDAGEEPFFVKDGVWVMSRPVSY